MHKSAARWAGVLLFLTGIATVVSVAARVSAGADQPTLEESLAVIAQNQAAYSLGGAARLVSGIALIFAGSFVYSAWGILQSVSSRLMLVPVHPVGSLNRFVRRIGHGAGPDCSGSNGFLR